MSIKTVLCGADFISSNFHLIVIEEATVINTDDMTTQIRTLSPLDQVCSSEFVLHY
jgi:hypothetical protein